MELAAVELGVLVAILLPRTFPGLNQNAVAGLLFTAGYGAYAVFPAIHGLRAWLLWATVFVAGVARIFVGGRQPIVGSEKPTRLRRISGTVAKLKSDGGVVLAIVRRPGILRLLGWTAAGLAVFFLVFFLVTGEHGASVAMSTLTNTRVSVVLSGLLSASFVGQEIVVPFVRPSARKLSEAGEDIDTVGYASAYIGWVERALVFALVAGGQPAAAALAITAKSLVRIPDIQQHKPGFVEYVLVGTLSSLLVAMAFAIVVRIAFGLNPL